MGGRGHTYEKLDYSGELTENGSKKVKRGNF